MLRDSSILNLNLYSYWLIYIFFINIMNTPISRLSWVLNVVVSLTPIKAHIMISIRNLSHKPITIAHKIFKAKKNNTAPRNIMHSR